jgi:hypothetical protein
MQIILPLTSTCKILIGNYLYLNQHICQINYQYNTMMTLLHLAVYISTLIKNFYYLQIFLSKQIQLRVLLDQVYVPGPLSNNSRCELCNISIVNMNVNSLLNKTELISTELGDHDIICITESRLNR